LFDAKVDALVLADAQIPVRCPHVTAQENLLFQRRPTQSSTFHHADSSLFPGIDEGQSPLQDGMKACVEERIMPVVKSLTQAQWSAAARR